ncbi:MAG: hypothetical protein CMH63_00650 [Nanoarchaeota archaeon]|nr:hypothetical protein [Nanoarchaeota archaeon]|tara:strand:- start:526 stop:1086 length:561 start_codon:yes stop_codon:yes gene_type:complete
MVKELKRQVFHILFGLVLVYLLHKDILNLEYLFGILLMGFVISWISRERDLPAVSWFLRHLDRERERFPGYGALTYVLGAIIVLGLFRKDIALASIMVLVLGDSFCHFGRFGKVKHPFSNFKFLEGTIMGIIAGTIGASFFVSWQAAFFGALVAMSVEGLDLFVLRKKIDDNLLIPFVSAIIISLF